MYRLKDVERFEEMMKAPTPVSLEALKVKVQKDQETISKLNEFTPRRKYLLEFIGSHLRISEGAYITANITCPG